MITKSRKKRHIEGALPWLIPVAIIIIWEVIVDAGMIDTTYVPSPSAVGSQAITLWQEGTLQQNIGISLYRATIGLLIGGTIGFTLGVANGLSRISNLLFNSTVQMVRNIPHLALIPLIIIWLGIGEPAKVTLVAIGVMFPIYINTLHGIQSIDPKLIEMGRSYQLSKWQMLTKIIFPGAMPTILMGIRYALGVMWTTLIVSETISSSSGIGYMETNAQQFLDMPTIFLAIIIYAILGKVSDWIAALLESIMLDWQ
ncbi:ABC transporter permease subunit [Weissella paramesenteroides]|jgi:sulfonate transport system permease protein|uniref:ABC transporter permease subunit n=1 Tax=Weissella paramesenteroides TaxID=1249 RepID=A0A4Q7IXS0_WEIPA|nr:ABC transporter permease subunit [Weissella paramesenteroides]KAA8439749.1 ABC transporter permease subunit [Weissella paramesenteroides]KAA8441776.1 ABC transporter permease subunit [Weissella paramesenteroides]KAA8444789.1 ABC transporter permease subunit [Weissella paramesenteroides]KAA8445345.1 ABC transporter permease subunit [Weissella paramesenteroides]KAA8446337.1 ABC transporter permease subunit [Weissella paramesenteroides]